MPFFSYQQYFSKRLAADYTAINTHMTTEGYFVSWVLISFFFNGHSLGFLQEDATGNFDSCESGSPLAMPTTVNPGYRLRKEQFAKQVPIKDPSTQEITGYKWIWADDSIFFCGPIFTGLHFTPLLPNTTIKVDFEINDPSFYFLSKTTTDLKVSFKQAILKVPKYQVSEIHNAERLWACSDISALWSLAWNKPLPSPAA